MSAGNILEFAVQGLKVRVDGRADAPPVVLAHAISTGLDFWDFQAAVWSHDFRVVRFDLRGHGGSRPPAGTYGFDAMADDVLSILDHLAIGKAAFVGLSLGGMVGQALALKAPARLSALVLAQTNARTPDSLKGMWQQRIEAVTAGGMASQVENSLARWFTPAFRERSPLTVAWIADMVRRTDPGAFIACCQSIAGLDFLERLGEISVPTLAVAGADDMAAPPANLQAIAQRIPGAKFLAIEQAAHLGNIEQPAAFTEGVGAFLKAHAG